MPVNNIVDSSALQSALPGGDSDLLVHRSVIRRLCDNLSESFVQLTGRSIVYFDQPVHMNIGDLAIYEGAQILLRSLNVNIVGHNSVLDLGKMARDRSRFILKSDLSKVSKLVDGADYIVFHGGGNFGDLWIDHQYMREAVIERFPSSKIIVFPQSVQFKSAEGWDRARRVLSSHKNIMFAARDAHSYDMMKDVCECIQTPDTAHMLWTDEETPRHVGSGGPVLTQSRRDAENMIGTSDANQFDWHDIVMPRDYASRHASEMARRLGIGRDMFSRSWNQTSQRLTRRAIERLAYSSQILTDRLHGVILASCAETPCVFTDTGYGKLTRYYEAWLKDSPLVRPA
jgi:pyruvyl transferase EpsO